MIAWISPGNVVTLCIIFLARRFLLHAELLPSFVAFREKRLILFLLTEAVASIAASAYGLVEVVAFVLAVRWEDVCAAAELALAALTLELVPECACCECFLRISAVNGDGDIHVGFGRLVLGNDVICDDDTLTLPRREALVIAKKLKKLDIPPCFWHNQPKQPLKVSFGCFHRHNRIHDRLSIC
jgi:hypothetical protein